MSGKSVIVVGAGVAGLTAAHELQCRGYDVTVLDSQPHVGGKSRSQYWHHEELGRLPGEHGYRFFPAFYWHLPQLMRRIPLDPLDPDLDATPSRALHPYGRSVADRLVPSEIMGISYPNRNLVSISLNRPRPRDFVELARDLWESYFYVPPHEMAVVGTRYIQFMSFCEERRAAYDSVTLWSYLQADRLSHETQTLLQTVPRCLVAMDAKNGNARTFLNTLFLMVCEPFANSPHRVLNGPSSAVWLEPWFDWLSERLHVRFRFDSSVQSIDFDSTDKRIASVTLASGEKVAGDHYVLAVPFERAQGLVSVSMADACAECHKLAGSRSARATAVLGRMTGAQIYLREPRRFPRGHFSVPYSPWGLTGIFQASFWEPHHFPKGVGDILSVCVTNLEGRVRGRSGDQMTLEEIEDHLAHQLCRARDEMGRPLIRKEDVLAFHLDDDLVLGRQGVKENRSRLLIHPAGFLAYRPRPISDIGNLCIAGDYVRNPIDLATMEGATYAALEAVNGIIDRDGSSAPRCELRDVRAELEPDWMKLRKQLDRERWDRGDPPYPVLGGAVSQIAAFFGDSRAIERWDRKFEQALRGRV